MRKCVIGSVAMALAASVAGAGDTYNITLDGMDFVYNGQTNMDIELILNVGDTVEWTWVSGFHNVASGFPGGGDEGVLFRSGDPTDTAGTTFSYTFMDVGTVGYFCEIHESMGMVSQVTVVPTPGAGVVLAAGLVGLRRRR